MGNGLSTVTISADQTGRRNSGARGRRSLAAVPAGRAEAAASTVVRVDLGPAEWALVVQPAGQQGSLPAPAGPARPSVSLLPCRFTLARALPACPGPQLAGTAVLLHRHGHAVMCCPENHITDRAALVLSALADRALCEFVGPGVSNGAADRRPSMTFTRIKHSRRPADDHHVASAELAGGCDVTFDVCHRVMSAELADVLGLLCTAYARILIELGRPGAEILAANDQ